MDVQDCERIRFICIKNHERTNCGVKFSMRPVEVCLCPASLEQAQFGPFQGGNAVSILKKFALK